MKSTTTSSSTTSQANSPKSIEIPTRDGSEVVEVFLDELPEEAEELCDILVSEEAPIELFKQFAVYTLGIWDYFFIHFTFLVGIL